MACALVAMSMVSCLSDDDDNGIDDETYRTLLANISGNYYGNDASVRTANKIYFWNDTISGGDKTDSIEHVEATFRKDSMLYVTGIPARLFTAGIKGNEDMKEAMEMSTTKTLTARFQFYNYTSPYAYYFVSPQEITYTGLQYGGATHEVKISFYGLGTGIYVNNSGLKQTQFTLVIGDITEDGTKVSSVYGDSWTEEKYSKSQMIVYATGY